jgi:hypothetical protein
MVFVVGFGDIYYVSEIGASTIIVVAATKDVCALTCASGADPVHQYFSARARSHVLPLATMVRMVL